jgi:hypothetical protein
MSSQVVLFLHSMLTMILENPGKGKDYEESSLVVKDKRGRTQDRKKKLIVPIRRNTCLRSFRIVPDLVSY